MAQALNSVLSLLQCRNVNELIQEFLLINTRRQQYDALLVGMLNNIEQTIECHYLPLKNDSTYGEAAPLTLDSGDFNHPLAQVIRDGSPNVWRSLNRGARIDSPALYQFIQRLPNDCGLYAIPLFDHLGHVCGVIALFAASIGSFIRQEGVFCTRCRVLQTQMSLLLEMSQFQQQLYQVRDVLSLLQSKQHQLDEMLASLSRPKTKNVLGTYQDLSGVNDLNKALAEYELAILKQRVQQYGIDKEQMALSLNLPLRTLYYRFDKYKGAL